MWEDNNIIVIDDNDQRRHDAQVILGFLGENPVTFSCKQWSDICQNEEAREKFMAASDKKMKFGWIQSTYKKLAGGRPIEEEGEIILDHNYDGIKELDNSLPPWWLYSFYITIIFAAVYLLRYHVFDGPTQIDEFETELAEAKIALEEYKKTAKRKNQEVFKKGEKNVRHFVGLFSRKKVTIAFVNMYSTVVELSC